MPESCFGPVCEWVHLLSQWLKIHVLPFGPLFTPLVAIVAGVIALYSVHVTRTIARRRAAIDFFLKTDVDKGTLEARAAFENALEAWDKHDKEGKPLKDFVYDEDKKYTASYIVIINFLNIYELIAVGIKNKVFDEDVCFDYWSDSMTSHISHTRELVQFDLSHSVDDSAFMETRNLVFKWRQRILRRRNRKKKIREQLRPPTSAPLEAVVGQNPVQPSEETKAANQQQPVRPVEPHQPPPAS